jgi:hypothetical protein
MKLTVGEQSIGFFDFDYKYWAGCNKIAVSMSGGTDSAILFYLMAKHLPKEIEIIPWTSYESSSDPLKERPYTIEAAEAVLDFVKNAFPDANIGEHYKFTYDRMDPEVYEEAVAMNVPSWHLYPMSPMGIVKILLMRREHNKCFTSGMFGMMVGGLTMNPPVKDMEGGWSPPGWKGESTIPSFEPRRNPEIHVNHKQLQCRHIGRSHYHPFMNVDKAFVAGLYEQEGLMDTLYPMTESCTGFAYYTNWFTEPCKRCFWCWEKYWAFGSYDGGLKE